MTYSEVKMEQASYTGGRLSGPPSICVYSGPSTLTSGSSGAT